MYLFKQVKVEKDALLVGRPGEGDLGNLFQQGYLKVLDIMPVALKDKGLARRVRAAGMSYTHIPVEVCDLDSCKIDEDWVVRFSRYMTQFSQSPLIINTDDETLGISLVVLSNLFPDGKPYQQVFEAVESLGFSLKGRKEIKRFIRIFYTHHKEQLTRKSLTK